MGLTVDVDVIQHELVVGTLHQVDDVALAPGQTLLVERNVRGLAGGDLEGLADQVVPLVVVGLDQDLLGQLIDLLVAVAAEVEGAALALLVRQFSRFDSTFQESKDPGVQPSR